jgi:predicted porin
MKKLTLAAAVAAITTSGSVNAITVFEKDSFKWKLNGDVQIQLLQDAGDDEDVDVNYDDTELKNYFTYSLENDMTAFARLDYNVKDSSGTVDDEEAYIGIDFGGFKFWIGKDDYVTDDFGVEKNIDVVDFEGDAFPEDESDDLILAEFKAGSATIGFSHDLEVGDDELTSTDIMVSVPAGPVDLGLAFQSLSESGVDADTFGISASGKFSGVKLGLAYSSRDVDGIADEFESTSFVVAASGFALGYEIEELGSNEVKGWYANYTHKLAKGFTAFVEVGDTDATNVDPGFLAGLRLKF